MKEKRMNIFGRNTILIVIISLLIISGFSMVLGMKFNNRDIKIKALNPGDRSSGKNTDARADDWQSIFADDFSAGVGAWTTGNEPITGSAPQCWECCGSRSSTWQWYANRHGESVYGNPNNGNMGSENSWIKTEEFTAGSTGELKVIFDSYSNNEGGFPCYYDVEWVEITTNGGGTWTPLHGNMGELHNYGDNTWRRGLTMPYNVDPYATFQIRWRYDTFDGCCGPNDGWCIDNVDIQGTGLRIGFSETFKKDLSDPDYYGGKAWYTYSSTDEGVNERVVLSPVLAEENPFTNPSFETGNTNGWVVDNSWNDWSNQRVWGGTSSSNYNAYFNSIPDGNYYYYVEMDTCCNPQPRWYGIGQDIQLPENAHSIEFDYSYYVDWTCCPYGDPLEIRVDIEPAGGGNPLETFILYETDWDVNMLHSEGVYEVDISAYAGQEVRFSFEFDASDWYYAFWCQFALDNFLLYVTEDVGFLAYDDMYCWRMDTGAETRDGENLNELVAHVGLQDVDVCNLKFATMAFGNDLTPDPMPASFQGHHESDGIAVSTDNETWYRLWQYENDLDDWVEKGPFDIIALLDANGVETCDSPSTNEDLWIKFQQYDDGGIPDSGIIWDFLDCEANEDAEGITLDVPRIWVHTEVSPDPPIYYAMDQGDPDLGTVNVTLFGLGDEEEGTPGTSIDLDYTQAPGIVVDGTLDWSAPSMAPGDINLVTADVTSIQGFHGDIGPIALQYEEWDGDIFETVLDMPIFRIMAFEYAEIEGSIIKNNGADPGDPGSEITLVSFDDQDPALEMPQQTFTDWTLTGLDDWSFEDVIDPETGQPFPHKKIVKSTGGEIGDEITITAIHQPTEIQVSFDLELTTGPATTLELVPAGALQYGLEGVLVVYIKDDYDNVIEDFSGETIYFVDMQEGDGGAFDVTGDDFLVFDGGQRGMGTFYLTPRGTWYEEQGDPPWYPGFRLQNTTGNPGPQDLWLEDILTVYAGPTDRFEMETIQTELYAGMPFNLFVQAKDETNHNNLTYDAPLIFSHNCDATGDLEPVPWKDTVGTVRYDMVDGQYNGGHAFYFNKSGGWSIGVKSGLNYAIAGSLNIDVMPGELNYLAPTPDPSAIVDPNIVADGRLLIPVSGDHVFDAIGYDAFGNLIDGFEITDWDVIDDIGEISEGEFHALAYFSFDDKTGVKEGEYIFKDGAVRVTGVGPLGVEVSHDILIRVYNPLNIWLVPDEIEPSGILLDHPLELKVPVHYYTPYENFPDNLQLKISAYIITDVDNNLNAIGGEHLIFTSGAPNTTFRLINLNEPGNVGIATYSFLIPYESIAGVIDHDQENKDNTNWLKVVIEDVPGGGEMGDFQWNLADDESKTELYAVYAPPPSETPSFAPAMAIMVLALLGGAVVANLYASSGDKKGRKDEDGVSPVIAIILMVAITIVLAGVLWLWVSGLVDTQKSNDIEYVDTAWESPTLQNDYQLIIENVKDKEFSVEDLEFSLMDGNKVDKSMGQHKVTAIYGKSIDNETIVSFHDGDHDGYLSTGDRFIIKSEDHDNYDGTPDPGEARAGYYFALKTKDNELFEVQIEQ